MVVRLKRVRSKSDVEFLRVSRNLGASVSLIKHAISKVEHLKWFNRVKSYTKIYLIMLGPKPIGYLRVNTHYFNDISILIIPEHRRMGYAKQALSLLPPANYMAVIKEDNQASLKLFTHLGYKIIEKVYILEKCG